jgi:hypothetical protein
VLREARAGGSSSSSGGSSQWRVLYQQPSGTFVQVRLWVRLCLLLGIWG